MIFRRDCFSRRAQRRSNERGKGFEVGVRG
jgi:hypothetical protein